MGLRAGATGSGHGRLQRELRAEELPPWVFMCGYREDWTEQPDSDEWYRQVREFIDEHAPHLIANPDDPGVCGYARAFRDERRRRRWGRLPLDPPEYTHPDGRNGYGKPVDAVLLPRGVAPLPKADEPVAPVVDDPDGPGVFYDTPSGAPRFTRDPRAVLREQLEAEQAEQRYRRRDR